MGQDLCRHVLDGKNLDERELSPVFEETFPVLRAVLGGSCPGAGLSDSES